MADVSKIKLPSGTTYNIKDKNALPLTGGSVTGPVSFGDSVNMDEATVGDLVVNGSASFTNGVKASNYNGGQPLYIVKGTQASTTASWTGEIDAPALYDGMTIAYYLPRTSASNVTLNLTLANGTTTGAIPVYVTNTTRMGTHYGAGATVYLTYWSAGSIVVNGTTTTENRWTSNDYWNSNTYDRTYLSNSGYTAGSTAIVAANIIVAGSDGLYKHLKSGTAFNITMPILYASSAANANAVNNGGYICIPFTVTTTQNITLSAHKPVFIKGTLSGTTFTPISTAPLTQTIPTSADGYQYIFLGHATTTTVMYLLPEHPIYEYKSGAFRLYGGGKHRELTQAEYDALTETEKMDGTVYFITDSNPIPPSLIDLFYPVGSYYETSNSNFDPNNAWGGTWVLEAEGLVHIGAGSNYTIGDEGGEATHTLTVDEIPSHTHSLPHVMGYVNSTGGGNGTYGAVNTWTNVGNTGGGKAHNIMQPYVVVNRWHRTA